MASNAFEQKKAAPVTAPKLPSTETLRPASTTTTAPPGTRPAAADITVQSRWRGSGRLSGNPPVKDEFPPNTNVPELGSEYNDLYASAHNLLKQQQSRAQKMLGTHGPKDFRYWFAQVYSMVTKNELEFAQEKAFHYPSYVMRCVLYFDKLYADNMAAAEKANGQVEAHWKEAFATSKAQQATGQSVKEYNIVGAVYSLVASMLAHIRYDLPRAEAWVYNTHYKPKKAQIEDFRGDFFSMSGVFDNASREMFSVMEAQFKKWAITSAKPSHNSPKTTP